MSKFYCTLYVYTMVSMCILWSICVYYDLNVYTMIYKCILWSICVYYGFYVYTMIYMCILWFLCEYYDLYLYTMVSMCILWFLCVYYGFYVYTMIYMCFYQGWKRIRANDCWLSLCHTVVIKLGRASSYKNNWCAPIFNSLLLNWWKKQ